MSACPDCLRRTWLLGALAPHLERASRTRRALRDVLALDDDQLLAALAGERRPALAAAHAAFRPERAAEEASQAGLAVVCRHDPGYPRQLLEDPSAPAVLHVRGGPGALERLAGTADPDTTPCCVAVVGARRAGPEALEMARGIGRALSAAGVTVVSGLALGVDSAAHEGALEAGGTTIAVLATGADRTYPRTKHALGERVARAGAIVSELPPGTPPFRWAFPARNRIIAGLARLTLVVEAAERSGSLITADFAMQLGRDVAAVPGRAASPRCRGTNLLLRDGAHLVLEPADLLDGLLGQALADLRRAHDGPTAPRVGGAAALPPHLQAVRDAVADGRTTPGTIERDPARLLEVLAALSELELLGELRRSPGGAYAVVVR